MEESFGRNFNFWMNFSEINNIVESERNWCFCQDFVSMEKEGRGQEFRSLEVREASSSHLKMKVYKTNWKTIKFGIKKFNLFIQACLSHSCMIVITDIASITDGVICNFTYQLFGGWITSTIKKKIYYNVFKITYFSI